MYSLRRRQRECGRKLAVARDIIAADDDVPRSDLFFCAFYSISDSHRLLFRGAADAFPELGALRRRRYRGQRPCGGQEEQAAHFCAARRWHFALLLDDVPAVCSLAELVVTCESCDCTNRCKKRGDLSKYVHHASPASREAVCGRQERDLDQQNQQCCERAKTSQRPETSQNSSVGVIRNREELA